jgi:hypothetical protein
VVTETDICKLLSDSNSSLESVVFPAPLGLEITNIKPLRGTGGERVIIYH